MHEHTGIYLSNESVRMGYFNLDTARLAERHILTHPIAGDDATDKLRSIFCADDLGSHRKRRDEKQQT